MLITIEQIKAARALLGWTQKDLAHHAELTVDHIRNFEGGRSRPLEVLESVYRTFSIHGIQFVSGGAILSQASSYILDSYMDLLNAISKEMPEGGEILKHCVDDRRSTADVIEKVQEMRKAGVKDRLTISDDNTYITGYPGQYRQIPKNYFASSEVVIIYLNKVAFFVDGKVLVIVSDALSRVFKDQFEYWWKQGKKLNG